MSLPTTRTFLTSLFTTLSKLPAPPDSAQISNPLISADAKTKNLFLTLHCLFPNELLPALDLLDRSLVTRFLLAPSDSTEGFADADTAAAAAAAAAAEPARDHSISKHSVYYVRSSQPSRAARYQTSASTAGPSYEVRLQGWNCSCPAFTFSALNALSGVVREGLQMGVREGQQGQGDAGGKWRFGGLSLGEGAMPVCKHLLACVLVEKCRALEGCVEERVVSKEEVAAWAAAWGG